MEDNKNPQIFNSKNDAPPNEKEMNEIDEKPYYEDNSVPLVENNNYSPSTNSDNKNYDINNKDKNSKNTKNARQSKDRIYGLVIFLVFSILLILIFIVDLILEIIYEFNPFLFVGGVSTLVMAIIYLIIIKKDKPINKTLFGTITILIALVQGILILVAIGMDNIKDPTIKILAFILMSSRFVILFLCMSIICTSYCTKSKHKLNYIEN